MIFVRRDDNLTLDVGGTTGVLYAGVITGVAVCFAGGGILCIPAMHGGVRLGSQAGKEQFLILSNWS